MASQIILKNVTDEQHAFIKVRAAEANQTMSDYILSLVQCEMEITGGALYRQLVSELPDDIQQALALLPVFVGGDSGDMDVFITEVWKRPVTEENMHQVKELFTHWYSLVAPDEYHDPAPVHRAWNRWSGE